MTLLKQGGTNDIKTPNIKRFNPTCAAVGFEIKSTVTRAGHAIGL